MKKASVSQVLTIATASLLLAQLPAHATLGDGLVGYWPLDTDLLDASGNGADGTFNPGINVPAPTPDFVAAFFGNGIDLNNEVTGNLYAEQSIAITGGAEDDFDFTGGSMSFSLWASSAFVTLADQTILAKGDGTSWRFAANGADPAPTFSAGALSVSGDSALYPLDDGAFHHYVGVAQAGVGLELYRDGELIASISGDPALGDSPADLLIGGNPESLQREWEGLIDDVGIWDRPLTPAEVTLLWNSGTGVTIGVAIDPTDTDGDTLPDFYESSNGLNPNDPADAAQGADDGLFDNDGLTNLEEFQLGTDPNDPDTDGDGLDDGPEVSGALNTFPNAPTKPLVADSDGDGLSDGEEVSGSLNPFPNSPTDPNHPDSDRDEATDKQEIDFGFDPNDPDSGPAPFQRGLKGFWGFDQNLLDGSGQGFDGIQLGTPDTPRFTTGKMGRAILLDGRTGVNQSIQIPNSGSAFDVPGGSVSISAWLRLSIASNAEPQIVGKGADSNYRLAINGASNVPIYNGGAPPISGGGSIAGPFWRHVVAISEAGAGTRLYLDGLLVAVGSIPPVLGSNGLPLEIGGNPEIFDMNWSGLFDEVSVWCRALNTSEVRQLWNDGAGAPMADLVVGTDTDDDGMSDVYETAHGLNPALDDSALDLDGDGLTNLEEFEAGSDPGNADTDGDGLEDDDEATAGSNPLGPDSDGDGLTDGEEVNTHNTDPTKSDTDNDGFNDPAELRLGSDPTDAGSVPGISPYVAAVLADEPIVYWQFDESSGTTASDSAGMGVDGTILGGVALAAESFHPNLGTAFHFDGASGRIDIPALGVFPKSSVEVWINTEGLAGGCCTSIYSSDTWASGNLHFNIKSGRDLEHAINGGGPNNNNTAVGLFQDGRWYHVVVTYDTALGGQTKFYIDGALVTTGAHGTANAMNLIAGEIGAWAGTRFYSGRMDEFAFYDHILTSEQVQGHYEAATAEIAPEAPSLNWALASEGTDLVFTWESKEGMHYNLRSEAVLPDLLDDPATWAIFGGNENIEAMPPENTLRVSRPIDDTRFFVIEEFPAPAP